MSTNATRHPSVRIPSGLLAYASFAIMVGGWVAFAVALVATQQTLDDVWTTVRDGGADAGDLGGDLHRGRRVHRGLGSLRSDH
jgi:hypothetical protein